MIERIAAAVAALCLRSSRRILLMAALLAAAALAAAALLTFDPDLLNLIPQKNRQVNDFRKVLRDMGTIDYHIIVLTLPPGHDVSEYETFIEDVASRYEKSPLIEEVSYKIPNPLELIDIILPKAFLFLDPPEIDALAQKLSDAGIREAVTRNRTLLETPQAYALKQLVKVDPFNLAPVFLEKFKRSGGGFRIDASSGYYLSADHTMALILTKPRSPAQQLPFSRQIMALSDQISRGALSDLRRTSPGLPPPKIDYTGGYAIAFDDSELIKKDVIANVLFSFFGVLALFLYAFRRVASIGYAGIPMSLGLAMTFGTAGLVYGTLSSASAGFAALLAGLGIDFITVIYGRYVDERNRGVEMPDAIRTTLRTTLPGVFVAAITTAATFYAFLATDFRGMTQLGFLTGTGIIFFLLACMFVLPALIIQTEKGKRGRAPKLYLHSFGSHHLIEFSVARPRLVVTLWTVFIVLSSIAGTQIRFSDKIQDLRAKGNRGIVTQERVTKKFGQSFDYMMYVIEGRSEDEVLSRTYGAARDLDGLVQQKAIASYQSISSFLPPAERQVAVIEKLRAGRADAFNSDRIESTFRAALEANGFRAEAYDSYLPLFRQALQPERPFSLADIHDPNILKLTTRFLKKTPTGWMSVIYLYPSGGVWGRSLPPALSKFAAAHPNSILTGVNLVSETLRNIVRADALRATTIGFIAVFILMFLSYRTVKMTLFTFVPFIAGASGMLGLMALMKLEFNFMNIFVGLMIIGVATDYAVYMLQRYIENPGKFVENASDTGKAVVMAAITSIVGYGSFALSHYPGLRSIGYASTFGIGLSGLAAITLLPAMLVMTHPKADEHGAVVPHDEIA